MCVCSLVHCACVRFSNSFHPYTLEVGEWVSLWIDRMHGECTELKAQKTFTLVHFMHVHCQTIFDVIICIVWNSTRALHFNFSADGLHPASIRHWLHIVRAHYMNESRCVYVCVCLVSLCTFRLQVYVVSVRRELGEIEIIDCVYWIYTT